MVAADQGGRDQGGVGGRANAFTGAGRAQLGLWVHVEDRTGGSSSCGGTYPRRSRKKRAIQCVHERTEIAIKLTVPNFHGLSVSKRN